MRRSYTPVESRRGRQLAQSKGSREAQDSMDPSVRAWNEAIEAKRRAKQEAKPRRGKV